MGAVFALTRSSLVRLSIRDLAPDGKILSKRISGVWGAGQNLILRDKTACQHSGQHPHFCQQLCQHPPPAPSGTPRVLYQVARISSVSGTNLCTGDFAPLEPEFGADYWETNFGHPNLDPNSWVTFFGSGFFQQKRPPDELTLEKFTSQNPPSKI